MSGSAVGRVATPTRSATARTSANSAIRSAGFHQAVSMKTFGWSGSTLPQPREVGDRGVGEDQPRVRELGRQRAPCRGPSAGIPRPAWIRTGTRRSWATRDDLAHARLVHRELLGARVQLDPDGAGVQAAARLGGGRRRAGRAGRRTTSRPSEAGGRGDRDVVGPRVAVGLVHREHDRARVRRAPSTLDQLGRRLLEAVGIVLADVGVRVEELERARGRPGCCPTRGGGSRRCPASGCADPTDGRATSDTGPHAIPPRARPHRDGAS